MFALGLLFNIVGIGLFCWAILSLTVYALPLFVATSFGLMALHSGAGVFGALLVGSLTAGVTLALGRLVIATARSRVLRGVVVAVFLIPAGVAGYYGILALSPLVVPSLLWREVFAWVGVAIICGTVWHRLTEFAAPRPIQGSGSGASLSRTSQP